MTSLPKPVEGLLSRPENLGPSPLSFRAISITSREEECMCVLTVLCSPTFSHRTLLSLVP